MAAPSANCEDERYCMALSAYNRQHKKDIKEFKPLQQKALDALVGGADCICCLPTGFGKSQVYEMLPFVDPNSLVVVVVPLNAIIAQQIQKLGSMAICLSKGKDLPTNHIADGTVRYIFTHPEDILNNRKITDFFRQDNVKRLNTYLVIDKAHFLKELKHMGASFPITVIYCKSIQWIGYGYEMARQILEDSFYAGEKTPENARVVMFHSSMENSSGKLKDMILGKLQTPPETCCLRLVFASVALGMGADLKHIQRVIHAGPPTTLETYVQEIGRSRRAESQAQAILYFNNNDLAVAHMQTNMKEYCRSDKCKRLLINEYFGFSNTSKPKICCNVCQPDLGLEWKFTQLSLYGILPT
ncbi:ATP-dependent DNA helicase RecQ-like [Mercenaria mercenaria]|uniref:ATP-dependent DNA helicase RecQ-like n=1 Tax=Mercenaria mercenaria TaxID=6596 RepID=UPI00234ECE90|nr:ATP-dependent DNA helicase RecQ-like [Mercenaria mercenaria]